MKIRNSFVSNSSSSSFICVGCDEIFAGWDGEYDVGTVVCDNPGDGRMMCEDCWDEGDGECPLCTNVIIPIDEKYTWMRSKLGMSEEQIEEAIRAERSKENK